MLCRLPLRTEAQSSGRRVSGNVPWVFCDIVLYSSLSMSPPSSGLSNKSSRAAFLLRLLLGLEDGGDMMFRNVKCLSTNYTALCARRQVSNGPGTVAGWTLAARQTLQRLTAVCLPQHLMSGWLLEYSYSCQPVDYSHSPTALRVSSAAMYMSDIPHSALLRVQYWSDQGE